MPIVRCGHVCGGFVLPGGVIGGPWLRDDDVLLGVGATLAVVDGLPCDGEVGPAADAEEDGAAREAEAEPEEPPGRVACVGRVLVPPVDSRASAGVCLEAWVLPGNVTGGRRPGSGTLPNKLNVNAANSSTHTPIPRCTARRANRTRRPDASTKTAPDPPGR